MALTKAGKKHKLENLLKEPGVQEYTVYLEAKVMADSIETAIKLGEQMAGYTLSGSVDITHTHVYMGKKILATAKYPAQMPF